ncbi:MAG: hypothetical protein DME25_18040 [Verrucomicrobia bacterium]|nr:MAG: hypothetical protein DME25_18040 [Verrucomicrobiota bacterium]
MLRRQQADDALPTDLTPPHCRPLSRYCAWRSSVVRALGRASGRRLLLLDGRGEWRGRLFLASSGASVVADPRPGAVLPPALVQHARRHGGARFGQGQSAWGNPERLAGPFFGHRNLCRRRAQRTVCRGERLLGGAAGGAHGVRRHVGTGRGRAPRIQRHHGQAVAHGDAARRRVDCAGTTLERQRHCAIWRADGAGLDLPRRHRRLRANGVGSAGAHHGGAASQGGEAHMNWRSAWESDVFRHYVGLVLGVLAVAGLALSIVTWVFKKDVRSIWATYRSWLVMAPLVLGGIFAGRVVVIVGLALVAGIGFKEFARATGLYRDWWMTGAVYLGIAAVGLTSLVSPPNGGPPGWYGLFMTLPVYVIALLLLVPIARNRTQGQLQALALAILAFVYIGWMFGHLGFLANAPHAYGYLLYLIFAVELNDVAAFTCGKLFGRHKFRSESWPCR